MLHPSPTHFFPQVTTPPGHRALALSRGPGRALLGLARQAGGGQQRHRREIGGLRMGNWSFQHASTMKNVGGLGIVHC